jgi:hypothetical protein
LQTMWAAGSRTLCPGAASSRDCPTTSSIHAPPLFSVTSQHTVSLWLAHSLSVAQLSNTL